MAPAATTTPDVSEEPKKTPLQLIISQGVCLPGIPKHPTFAAHRQCMLEKMALAFRVFARLGYTDGMAGHISVRDPEKPSYVLDSKQCHNARIEIVLESKHFKAYSFSESIGCSLRPIEK